MRGAWKGKGKEANFGSVFVPFVNYLDTDVPCSSSSRGNDVPIHSGAQAGNPSVLYFRLHLFHLWPVPPSPSVLTLV